MEYLDDSLANFLRPRLHGLVQSRNKCSQHLIPTHTQTSKGTGDKRLKSQSEIDAANHTFKDDLAVLSRAFTLIFTEPIVFVMDLYVALLYGVLFIWFESFPVVFGGIYHFNEVQQGFAFLGIFVGTLVTLPTYFLWIKYSLIPKFSDPTFKPEVVLPPAWFGSISLPICLFFYGWSACESVHWIVPIIGTSFFAIGLVTLFQSCLNYLAISNPLYAASLFAGNGLSARPSLPSSHFL
jgi:DHA1 family multidrug resistance protein-like MFS transporter